MLAALLKWITREILSKAIAQLNPSWSSTEDTSSCCQNNLYSSALHCWNGSFGMRAEERGAVWSLLALLPGCNLREEQGKPGMCLGINWVIHGAPAAGVKREHFGLLHNWQPPNCWRTSFYPGPNRVTLTSSACIACWIAQAFCQRETLAAWVAVHAGPTYGGKVQARASAKSPALKDLSLRIFCARLECQILYCLAKNQPRSLRQRVTIFTVSLQCTSLLPLRT